MKKKLNILLPVIQALFLSFIVFLSLNHISCKVSSERIQVLSGDYESPELHRRKGPESGHSPGRPHSPHRQGSAGPYRQPAQERQDYAAQEHSQRNNQQLSRRYPYSAAHRRAARGSHGYAAQHKG